MPRWTDVRVYAERSGDAVLVLARAFAPANLRLDTSPPAAGPEHEVQIEGQAPADVERVLLAAGIPVLAIRPVLRGELRWDKRDMGPGQHAWGGEITFELGEHEGYGLAKEIEMPEAHGSSYVRRLVSFEEFEREFGPRPSFAVLPPALPRRWWERLRDVARRWRG